MELNKAIFVSLNGTLIKTNSGRKYPLHSADWHLVKEVVKFIEAKYLLGYKVIIITNQEEVANGYVAEATFIKQLGNICLTLEKNFKFKPNSICYEYCIEHDTYYTLPNAGMLYNLAIEHELNLKYCIMVGNDLIDVTDIQTAANSGIGTFINVLDVAELNQIK